MLGVVQRPPLLPVALTAIIATLARSSYALFLVHFSVLILANAWFAHLGSTHPIALWSILIGAWATSQCVALVFERWVERPLSQLKI
jgi:peptidoglycan/LPS O-acetylase OafA/YrhL